MGEHFARRFSIGAIFLWGASTVEERSDEAADAALRFSPFMGAMRPRSTDSQCPPAPLGGTGGVKSP